LYIYSKGEISLDFREKIADKYFNYAELNNTTWEQEDQGFFKGTLCIEIRKFVKKF